MLSVFPFCLIRKTEEVSSYIGASLNCTESINTDKSLKQYFIAQSSYIDYLELDISPNVDITTGNKYCFVSLYDENESLITQYKLNLTDKGLYFWHIPVKKWVKKNHQYCINISVDEGNNDNFGVFYTYELSDAASGLTEMYLGDEFIDGETFVVFGYGFPLNIKNIIFAWSFALSVLFAFCGLLIKDNPVKNKKLNDLFELASKFKLPLLLAEVILFAIALFLISRNLAVDWDEAYSINMIRKHSFFDIIKTTAMDIHPPLYYIILYFWIKIFGDSFLVFKLFSVMFTVLTMLLGATLINKHFGFKTAFPFIILVGIGPEFINYAVNIRMYSMALFFVTLSGLLGYLVIKKSDKKILIPFVAASLAGVYTHYFTAVPLFIIYLYVLTGFIKNDKLKIRYFIISVISSVLLYVPWLPVMFSSFGREGKTGEVSLEKLDFYSLCSWAFETNLKCSVLFPLILIIAGLIIYLITVKKRNRNDTAFIGLTLLILPVSFIVCFAVGSSNKHFWDYRYIYPSLAFIWLFILITVSSRNKLSFVFMSIFVLILSLSSYRIAWQGEIGTNSYMNYTYEVIDKIQNEDELLYNFTSFDMLYSAHLPNATFYDVNEYDFDNSSKDYIYMFEWGSAIPDDIRDNYVSDIELVGVVRFEQGVDGVKLLKLNLK